MLKNRRIGLCRSEHRKIWRFFFLRIPFEINKQKKTKKLDLKREYERIPRIMGAQTVQERSGVFFSFGYRNENNKTSDLDSADCVAKICWIIVPAATSEEKIRRISCTQSVYVRSVGFFLLFWICLNILWMFYLDLLGVSETWYVLVTQIWKKGCTPINLIAESMSLPWAVPIETPSFWNFFVGKNRCHLV